MLLFLTVENTTVIVVKILIHVTLQALIVEDNMVNQRLLRAMLARLGLQADTVDNGQMCLDIIKERVGGGGYPSFELNEL